MRYISLFAGIGGFDLALNRLGHQCVYANEWDKYANSIYTKRIGQCDNRDIRTVATNAIPAHELLVGGFPCQAFSIAGKRRGFDDTRGTLFFEIARILKDKQPKYFILENVKGLLSHNNGDTFKTIITTLTELGYDLQWQVLNSKNFGVPQNRERVFIVGHIRGEPRPEVFPIREDDELHNEQDSPQTTNIVGAIRSQGDKPMVANTLTANYWKGPAANRPLVQKRANQSLHRGQIQVEGSLEGGGWEKRHEQTRRVFGVDGVAPTVPTASGGGVIPKIFNAHWARTGERGDGWSDKAFTMDSGVGRDQLVNAIRRLTPLECERLQGFPDNWTEGISDTQRYKCCGNAVTVNVVYEVAMRMS